MSEAEFEELAQTGCIVSATRYIEELPEPEDEDGYTLSDWDESGTISTRYYTFPRSKINGNPR